MTITIISLSPQPLIIDMVTPADHKFIASLFKRNEVGDILAIQTADKQFKTNLSQFDSLHKKYRKTRIILSQIPDGTKFILVDRPIKDSMELQYFYLLVLQMNGGEVSREQLHTIAAISPLYSIFTFDGQSKHLIHVGESDKTKRICRFCGKSVPIVSFSDKSHAISESIGNKSLICNEECDDCNERFSRTIEPDMVNMLGPLLTINAISGKHGIRKTTGKNFKLSLDRSTATEDNIGTLKFILNEEFPADVEQFLQNGLNLDTSNLSFVPQNIYKCLCKYALSLMDSEYLVHFKETINWINSPTKYCKLPMLATCSTNQTSTTPQLLIAIRKNDTVQIPYCIGALLIMNNLFAFILPFANNDRWRFITKAQSLKFLELINFMFKEQNWSLASLSSSRSTYMRMDFSLTIQNEE